ncbi:MAG: Ldh family oxidoreductase, partial [Pirellulaceae bacterium]|nr:Ldh family oxidoreductase [Pirellulaceae bacterium]
GGGWNVRGCPTIDREGPGWAVIDGAHALGQVGGTFAMRTAIQKARHCGIAFVGLRHTAHLGATGYFAWLAADEGLLGLVTGNDIPSVAAPNARAAVLGSNPLAYCAPAQRHPPLLLDMATAAVAGGKVYAAYQRGEPIPATWLIGPDGHPTTDGSLYPQQAALAPMAGHKGYGLGLLAELLAGVMPGGAMTWQVGSWIFDDPRRPSRHNAALIAIDVQTLCGAGVFEQRVDQLIDELHAAPKAEGAERILVPGELEWERRREALEQGIPLPPDVLEKIDQVVTALQVPAPWA